MAQYANIIVDISHEKLDKTFQYRIPEELRESIRPGMQVYIPFGNRKLTGYVVELTEDSYAHDRETALRTIEGLHAMGLRIVLDDIGAGYSSLSDLSTYPIDGVKIDRSIVIESALPRAHALLEGMIRLSHDMGIRVLCEGVEDKATCDAVLAAGCDFIQGFYFSRVLPGREAESFLRSLAARDREEG